MPNAITNDGLQSAIHAMGDPERDKAASVYFAARTIQDAELVAAYESNWMTRGLVDIPVMDALRKGWRWGGDKHETLEAEELRLNVAGKMMRSFKKGRLFGGAALYIGTDQEPSEPLEIDKIGVGGVKYLNVMTRLQLNAGEIDTDPLSEHYGTPKAYTISSPTGGQVVIHPSRLVLFNGDERADNMTYTSPTGWPGMSVVQSAYNALTDAQGTFSNIASLVYEANIDVIGIPNLMDNIGSEGYESDLMKRIRLFVLSKGVNGTGVMDAEETLDRKTTSFSTLPQLMETFAVFVAAAGQIPATRFLAQSPSGLVSTGESDMKNYYDLVGSKQKLEINPATSRLFACIRRSALGTDEPIPRTWMPLEEMDEQELADMGKKTAETIKIMVDTGAIEGSEARALLVHKMAENGSMPHIEETLNEALGSPELD